MTSTLLVHKPGLHTTVQDLGRHGLQSMGVPVSGALDSTALRIANHLVGNKPTTAALEVLGSGPDLEVKTESVRIAIAGGDARIERLSPNPGRFRTFESFCLQRGDLVRIGAVTDMAMTYLAVEGGFDLPLAMGSASLSGPKAFPAEMGDRTGATAFSSISSGSSTWCTGCWRWALGWRAGFRSIRS